MNILVVLAMIYATIGLFVSLCVHVLSIFGFQPTGEGVFFALHVGIFPLWFFVGFLANKMFQSGRMQNGFWKVALRGCPAWMRYMTYVFFIYAFVNFILINIIFVGATSYKNLSAGGPSPAVWHGFSGHWMAFYCAGLAVATSVYRIGWANIPLRCSNGHVVSPNDSYCTTCGIRV